MEKLRGELCAFLILERGSHDLCTECNNVFSSLSGQQDSMKVNRILDEMTKVTHLVKTLQDNYVIHLDLHSGNIVLVILADGTVRYKVIDLGWMVLGDPLFGQFIKTNNYSSEVKKIMEIKKKDKNDAITQDQALEMVLKCVRQNTHMPPEAIRSGCQMLTKQADIFSLGAMFGELLRISTVKDSKTIFEIRNLITKCKNKDPKKRPTIEKFEEKLQKISSDWRHHERIRRGRRSNSLERGMDRMPLRSRPPASPPSSIFRMRTKPRRREPRGRERGLRDLGSARRRRAQSASPRKGHGTSRRSRKERSLLV